MSSYAPPAYGLPRILPRPNEGFQSLGTGITDGCGSWESNQGPLVWSSGFNHWASLRPQLIAIVLQWWDPPKHQALGPTEIMCFPGSHLQPTLHISIGCSTQVLHSWPSEWETPSQQGFPLVLPHRLFYVPEVLSCTEATWSNTILAFSFIIKSRGSVLIPEHICFSGKWMSNYSENGLAGKE